MIRVMLLMLLALSTQAWGAEIHKWVDDNGVTHYGDTIPPEAVNKATSTLNRSGTLTSTTRAVSTEAERKAMEEEEARKREAEQKDAERKRRDNALLDTYTSEQEIDLARDRNLQFKQLSIDSDQMRVKSIQGRLDGLRDQANLLVKNRKPIPGDLADEMKKATGEIRQLEGNIAKDKQEMNDLRARFEDDKKRYRELRGGVPH